MKKYKLLMRGENFLIQAGSELEKQGFYQTVFLESNDFELAEKQAVDLIRNSDLKALVKNAENDPPMIYLEEIDEIENLVIIV